MPYNIERLKTGVSGLDKLIQGGFEKGSTVLVSGKAGTGKTLLCLQYLWEGLKSGETGIYLSFEETADEIRKDALAFGWDLKPYEKKKKFGIVEKNLFENPDLEFFEVDKMKAKRLVIDSVSILSLMIADKAALRNRLNGILSALKERGVTTLLVSEGGDGSAYSRLGIEEFIADAVVSLDFVPIGPQSGRSLFVSKMRRTKHSENIHPIDIGKNGIRVLSV